MSRGDGGAAFPRTGYYPEVPRGSGGEALRERIDTMTHPERGMSLRAWLAGKALEGLLASGAFTTGHADATFGHACDYALDIANGMLWRLAKPPTGPGREGTPPPEAAPYELGREARLDGRGPDFCPYRPGARDHEQWFKGYDDAGAELGE